VTGIARFGIGGLGGLLPILASLLAVDLTAIATIVDHRETISMGLCVGYGLRVLILFALGGLMAVLNSEIENPFALIQIGIAAPALITSFASGAALNQSRSQISTTLSFVGIAYAAALDDPKPTILANFLNDVVKGLTPGLGQPPPRGASLQDLIGQTCRSRPDNTGLFDMVYTIDQKNGQWAVHDIFGLKGIEESRMKDVGWRPATVSGSSLQFQGLGAYITLTVKDAHSVDANFSSTRPGGGVSNATLICTPTPADQRWR
jgi:hypothetical protein